VTVVADSKIDPFDVGALERAVNDSATRVSGLWLSFVAFSAYLAAAASMISHRQIFLEDPIKLPTINIDLPLVASAILLPLLFVIYHVFLLLQVVLLARTADAYNRALDHATDESDSRMLVRQRLANTLFAQLFAGSPREREGVLGWLLRGMAWITLAIAPVLVLILFEIKFLPYHSAAVTWTHRGLIALDLLAILLLWAGAVDVRRDIALRSLMHDWKTALGAAVIVLVACCVLTFPGELGRFWTAYLDSSGMSEGEATECHIPWVFGAVGPGFDRLVLGGEDFVDDDKLKRVLAVAKENGQKAYQSERTRLFHARDLRCGRFSGADLRHVDFSEADLTGAILRGARLEGATFSGARLDGAVLEGAQLQEAYLASSQLPKTTLQNAQLRGAQLQGVDLREANLLGAQLQEVNLAASYLPKALQNAQLRDAQLQGADLREANLSNAQLQQANLDRADLRGASLKGAVLRAASLRNAKLQGASLRSADAQEASFDDTDMQGVSLVAARMQGASFEKTRLHGVLLSETFLQGATFRRTELHGAVFANTWMEGTLLVEPQLQGATFQIGSVQLAVFLEPYLWRASGTACNTSHVVGPHFDGVIHDPRDGSKLVPAEQQAIIAFIDRSLQEVPESSRAVPEFSKSRLRDELTERLRDGASDPAATGESSWKKCAEDAEARETKGFGDLIAPILRYLCEPGDRNQAVTTMLRTWMDKNLSDTPVAKTLAQSLLEGDEKCPGAKTLNEATKQILRDALK
jgi:uncharacterized protein YjbI with pentapeptide repeats